MSNQICKCDLKYKQLSSIEDKHLQQIKLVFIFANFEKNDIIFITSMDEIYVYGYNSCGKLGLGHTQPVAGPKILPELCGKCVTNIESGQQFMAAITQFGDIYVWGQTSLGQQSYHSERSAQKPQKITFTDDLAANIKCCANKTIVLTQTNQIYWFGQNSSGTTSMTPSVIKNTTIEEMTDICCGKNHSLSLSEFGRVYSWGSNEKGQLGLGHHNTLNDAQPIPFPNNELITSISCGSEHSLLLTNERKIYSFGNNSSGQLGTGDNTNRNTPTLIKMEKCFEILAFEEISMALCLTKTRSVYIWGKTKHKSINKVIPYKTRFQTFQESIDFFVSNPFTYKPFTFDDIIVNKPKNAIIETMAKAFNRQKYSDLKFKIKRKGTDDEFDYIYGHKWFIAETSEHFKNLFEHDCLETKTNEIPIDGFSFRAYYGYIRCLYTDSIETRKIDVLTEILSISEMYTDLKTKTKCVQTIKRLIEVQNVSSFYSSAVLFKSTELEEFCFKFMSTHISYVTDTQDYKQMDDKYAKHFLTRYSKVSLFNLNE